MQYDLSLRECPITMGLVNKETFIFWRRYVKMTKEDTIVSEDEKRYEKPVEKLKCRCNATYRAKNGRKVRVEFSNSYKGHACVARVFEASDVNEVKQYFGATEISKAAA